MNILYIILIVLLVLVVLGFFGVAAFRFPSASTRAPRTRDAWWRQGAEPGSPDPTSVRSACPPKVEAPTQESFTRAYEVRACRGQQPEPD